MKVSYKIWEDEELRETHVGWEGSLSHSHTHYRNWSDWSDRCDMAEAAAEKAMHDGDPSEFPGTVYVKLYIEDRELPGEAGPFEVAIEYEPTFTCLGLG